MSTHIKLIAVIAAMVAFAAVGIKSYNLGQDNVQTKWDATKLVQITEAHEKLVVGMQDSFDTGVAFELKKEDIKYVTNTIIKKIPVYVKADPACARMPDNWGMLYNASSAAANAAVTSGQLDDEGAAALLGREPK